MTFFSSPLSCALLLSAGVLIQYAPFPLFFLSLRDLQREISTRLMTEICQQNIGEFCQRDLSAIYLFSKSISEICQRVINWMRNPHLQIKTKRNRHSNLARIFRSNETHQQSEMFGEPQMRLLPSSKTISAKRMKPNNNSLKRNCWWDVGPPSYHA